MSSFVLPQLISKSGLIRIRENPVNNEVDRAEPLDILSILLIDQVKVMLAIKETGRISGDAFK